MREILSLIIMGIALSMDTFSLALSVGTFNIDYKKMINLSLFVAIFHFFMPFLGMIIGNKLITLLELQCDVVLGIVLIIIAIQIIIDVIKKKEETFNLNFLGMLLFAFSVSIDSFSLGLGLKAITDNIVLAMSIFAVCSGLFTFAGLAIGKYATKYLGTYANIIGAGILIVLGVCHLI